MMSVIAFQQNSILEIGPYLDSIPTNHPSVLALLTKDRKLALYVDNSMVGGLDLAKYQDSLQDRLRVLLDKHFNIRVFARENNGDLLDCSFASFVTPEASVLLQNVLATNQFL